MPRRRWLMSCVSPCAVLLHVMCAPIQPRQNSTFSISISDAPGREGPFHLRKRPAWYFLLAQLLLGHANRCEDRCGLLIIAGLRRQLGVVDRLGCSDVARA